MTIFSRRKFIKTAAAASSTILVSNAMTACMAVPEKTGLTQVQFSHGVASGDPTANAVIIWTRAIPLRDDKKIQVAWEVAKEASFDKVIRAGMVNTSAQQDFTIKVDLRDLEPDTQYFYRFIGAGQISFSGKTKTLSNSHIDQIKMVVVSCSNYPAGYFNAYTEAAKIEDLDCVLHLGDYIYEYEQGGYATENADKIGRSLASDNNSELITLSDYRKRYALYRTDSGLQALHAHAPFIVVWDDHEITNDAWTDGAQNHNKGEGKYLDRKAAAIQAYYEWLPIRPPMGPTRAEIYRHFQFGDLISLHMLDTRLIGRNEQLKRQDFQDPDSGAFNKEQFKSELVNPQRTLLGSTQLEWLVSSLSSSDAKWQILGQQILMGKMLFPAAVISNQGNSHHNVEKLAKLKHQLLQGQTLTVEQTQLLEDVIPYNLDAWDGYPAEREKVYAAVKKMNKNLVVLAGDTHNAWYNKLSSAEGDIIGVEFATPSVSSPGMEQYLKLDDKLARKMAKALAVLIDDLQYCNLHQRGFLNLTISHTQIASKWVFIDEVLSQNYQVADTYTYIHSPKDS